MTKRLAVERLYSLGDYKNIKFIYEETDLPSDVNVEEAFQEAFAHIEKAYINYKVLLEKIKTQSSVEGAFELLNSYLTKNSVILEEKKGD